MTLPTDVALKSSSYEGSTVSRLATLDSEWIFSWPDPGAAPFMEEVSLLAGEEFNALVFNAMHGYYRQAIGCLRNALEILIAAAGLAVTENQELFNRWRNGERQIGFGQARARGQGRVLRYLAPSLSQIVQARHEENRLTVSGREYVAR